MPNGDVKDIRVGPPPSPGRPLKATKKSAIQKNEGFWGYLVDPDEKKRCLYWDRDLIMNSDTKKVEYVLEEVSLILSSNQIVRINMAIITKAN